MRWLIALLVLGLTTSVQANCPDIPGDITGDGIANVSDVQCSILSTLSALNNGPPPACLSDDPSLADLDCDGVSTITDIQLLIGLALGIPISTDLDADGNLCVDVCEADEVLCESELDQATADALHMAITGTKRIQQMTDEIQWLAISSTCGTRTGLDREGLNAAVAHWVDAIEKTAALTQANGMAILNSSELVLSTENGDLLLPQTPKTVSTLFNGESLSVDTWNNAQWTQQSLLAGKETLSIDLALLEEALLSHTNNTGCLPTPPETAKCDGLSVVEFCPGGNCPTLCDPLETETCLLALLHTAAEGLNAADSLLGEIWALTTESTCGVRNASDRLALNGTFQELRTQFNESLSNVSYNGAALFNGDGNGLILPYDIGMVPGETQSQELVLPALGNNGLLSTSLTLHTQTDALLVLDALQAAQTTLEMHRRDLYAQADILQSLFGCDGVYQAPAQSPLPSALPDLLSACEQCQEETQLLLDTATAGYAQITSLLYEMKAKALVAVDPNTSFEQRQLLDEEAWQLKMDIDNIAATTEYNGYYLLGGGQLWGSELLLFHTGIRNTIHNMKAHMFFSQSSFMLLSAEAPNLQTQMDAQLTLDIIDSGIFVIQIDHEALLATETTLTEKMTCELFIPDDITGPGEKCTPSGPSEGCKDCQLQHCFLIDSLQQSYEALSSTLLEMKTLAIESTNPNITDMERAFLDTHFQDHISSMDMLVGVLEYNFISPLAGDGFGGSTILSTLYDGGTFTPWVAELLLIPVDTYSLFLGDWLDVSTWFTAETAIVNIDLALETLAAHTAYLEEPAAEFNCVFP